LAELASLPDEDDEAAGDESGTARSAGADG